ncbi:hypothetical protein CH286_25560 [Rhodococcus sp. WWJCD1]|uniref:3-oxo-tetronate kinase n=1 Tax=unclassified Rhodococcus (in: high G+C Gram-positive bacteria) TaxID=192944 RepID=UPI000B9B02BE|nr:MULTISPECIES: 3-oxo-tetronate kinase [unclassified Rhodococcus (in: high G+C Gram-positive bacteria)]OZC42528.1 hypothetical protein CH286_25560 [Rhodococcus sp. WWJCD1]OZE89244.1 hypothetical protein CH302_28040 [Rhodococcus sp. 15-2388-1-1a]
MSTPKIGCIADDYTGGTDVAAALRRHGLRTVLLFGLPEESVDVGSCDAVVVALKTRSLDAEAAVKMSLAAHHWLAGEVGIPRTYFKYCSTFDSTDDGNIGPVADALLEATGDSLTVSCPAAPEHGRTVYQGHLFVGDRLLSESSMRYHPLTPMTDSDIVAVLGRQTTYPVSLVDLAAVHRGPDSIGQALASAGNSGVRHVVIDAVEDADLMSVAEAVGEFALVAGSAGLAGALGKVLHDRDTASVEPAPRSAPTGPTVIFAGSCSQATLGQVAQAKSSFAHYRLDPRTVASPEELLPDALEWMQSHIGGDPILMYSSASADDRGPFDPAVANELERMIGALAKAAVDSGAERIVVAGGETSGAVVDALGVKAVVVDAEMDRGVPWCSTTDDNSEHVTLLLKSGNFGQPDLLVRAATIGVLG